MAKYSKTLQLIATKLGLNEEDNVLSKAAEFERLLQMKSTANSNITDTGKVVICLDLAASCFGANLDLKQVIKYSGLKSSVYMNCRKVVENLLELNSEKLTTAVLCAALSCSAVKDLADNILQQYQKKAKVEIDLNLPQYVCMAVYQACRINKVKVSKGKIIEKSRIKPAQWAKLDAEWTKFVDENFASAKKKKGRPAKTAVQDEIQEKMEIDIATKTDELQMEPQIESYEDWKRRVLEAAHKNLKKLQETEKAQRQAKDKREVETQVDKKTMTPRRSPRKTPQKFEPYKSPNKSKGVRLLFPVL